MIKNRTLIKLIFGVIICGIILSIFTKAIKFDYKNNSGVVFRYNEHKNISSLDPAFAKDNADIWAINQLFNGLVQMNETLEIVPSIATHWEISENAKVYTFYLRKDVYYHPHHLFGKNQTRTVIASDFVYSFNRLKDPRIASPGSWVLNSVDSYQAINDHTFQITLKTPFPAFLGLLTMKYCSVVPMEITEHYGSEFRSNPIGTGAFKFKRWEENIKLVFRKHNNYFETDNQGQQLPYIEAVAITFLPDKQSEYLQFVQGNIDFISGLDASYKDDILTSSGALQPKYKSKIKMKKSPYLNTEYLGVYVNSRVSAFQSKNIRQAINYGFDRHKMITYLRNGIGIPANGGFIPKGLPGHSPSVGYDYQPERAKELVKTYIENNHLPPSITITTTSNYLSFCEYIQKELQHIGIEVFIEVMTASTLKTAKANGKTDFFRASWVADYPDAENYLSLFYSKNKSPKGPNYTHFEKIEFDDLYQKALLETDANKRQLLYKEMDAIVMDNAPVVVLFYDEVLRFISKNISGLGINPINILDLKRVKKTKIF
jgi:peptide/nickel transport system substrate-binding protein